MSHWKEASAVTGAESSAFAVVVAIQVVGIARTLVAVLPLLAALVVGDANNGRANDSTSDEKRVSGASRSTAYWSSEIVFLKLSARGCGAAVRYEASAEWPPSTSGCDNPEKTVKSRRKSLITSKYGEFS